MTTTNTRNSLLVNLREVHGKWVSGEALSRKLNISRTAVWKHLCSLRNEGYIIDSAPRKGYLLRHAPDRIIPSEIEAVLQSTRLGRPVVFENQVDSTNRLARDLAIGGASEGTVVVAESQTKGRGRKGRSWHSPAGEGIYLSLILKPHFHPADAPKMTLLSGVALAETLIPIVPSRVTIKWPNDVLAGGKKIAGILVEVSTEIDAINHMVIGVGLNVNTPPGSFPAELSSRATSLAAEAGRPLGRIDVLCAFLLHFERFYDRLDREGFAPVIRRWRELSDMAGRRVRVHSFNRSLEGTMAGIDDDGTLLLDAGCGTIERVLTGDVEYL